MRIFPLFTPRLVAAPAVGDRGYEVGGQLNRRTFLWLAVAAAIMPSAVKRVIRVAVIKHPGGAVTRRVCAGRDLEEAQDKAIAWLARTMRPLDGDEMIICYPEFDVWPKSPADYERLYWSADDLVWLHELKAGL
jgi:hypothetical protein